MKKDTRDRQAYQAANKERIAANRRRTSPLYIKRRRRESIDKLGGQCACCTEKTDEFLTIDHINGRGATRKSEVSMAVYGKILGLLLEKAKQEYRVLCINCDWSIGRWGYCPHDLERVVSH